MAANYVLLEKITVGAAGTTSVTFSNIPQTGYTDLVLKTSIRSTHASNSPTFSLAFNGSSSLFTSKYVQGSSSAASSGSENRYGGQAVGNDATANTFSNDEILIADYTSANYKSYSSDSVSENNASAAGSAYATLIAGLWSNTAAITSIKLQADLGNFVQYSTASLYGILKY